jgi:hypothetical protein
MKKRSEPDAGSAGDSARFGITSFIPPPKNLFQLLGFQPFSQLFLGVAKWKLN